MINSRPLSKILDHEANQRGFTHGSVTASDGITQKLGRHNGFFWYDVGETSTVAYIFLGKNNSNHKDVYMCLQTIQSDFISFYQTKYAYYKQAPSALSLMLALTYEEK